MKNLSERVYFFKVRTKVTGTQTQCIIKNCFATNESPLRSKVLLKFQSNIISKVAINIYNDLLSLARFPDKRGTFLSINYVKTLTVITFVGSNFRHLKKN